MLTVDDLCAAMAASDRHLTPRAARDWWTKGLLPKPRRHGLGRGKGTETFWTEPRIVEQAQAAYDFLAQHGRVNTALLNLWLWGFAIDLGSIRAIYRRLISRHFGWVRRHSGQRPDGIVGDLAAMFARKIIKSHGAPTEVRNAVTDLAAPFFEIFYGVSKKLDGFGLAEYWEAVAPVFGKSGFADLHPRDDDLEAWSRYLKEMASLPAQHAAMSSATDYELIRARRLVLLVFGYLGRMTRVGQCEEELAEFGRCLLIAFGRPAVPILIMVLRDESLRNKIVSSILDFIGMLPRAQMRPSLRLSVDRPRIYH
jgi:hypothetical protein